MSAPVAVTPGVQLRVVESADIAVVAGAVVAHAVRNAPEGVLGIATGRTPERLYAELARLAAGGLDCSRLTIAALDEYVGLAADDPRSYRSYVMAKIAAPLGIPAESVLMPSAGVDGARFDDVLAARGGVDLQILGIGRNGHIGFNEPGSAIDSATRVVELTASTRADNAEYFGGDADAVPTHAATQGIGTILRARHVLLLASGESKLAAVRAAIGGAVTADVPASALQTHRDVVVIADTAAAGPR